MYSVERSRLHPMHMVKTAIACQNDLIEKLLLAA